MSSNCNSEIVIIEAVHVYEVQQTVETRMFFL